MCMPGRGVEERVKSNEAAKGTRGSQQTSKGRTQGRGHGGHTASTTPQRDTGEGSTGGPREEQHDTHGTDTTHTAHTQRTPATHPAVGGQTGEGQRLTPSAPQNGGRHPPRGRPSATPTASNAGPQGRTLWGRCWVPTPAATAPGTRGSRNPGCTLRRTGGRGRDSAWHQAPLTTVEGTPPPGTPVCHPHSKQRRPARAHAVGPVLGPHARIDRTRDTRVAEPWLHAPEDERPGEGQRLTPGAPHNGGRHPPPGTPFRHPHSEQSRPARAHAVGPVLGPHARIDRTRDTRVAEPWLHAPEDERPGEEQRLTPGAPHNGGRHPPPGTPFRHPHSEQRRPARAHAAGPVLGPHARIDRTRDTRVAEPWLHAPEDERPGKGQRLTPGAPHNGGRQPPRGRPSATPTASNAGPQGRTLWGRCWVHTPASTAPGTRGSRNPGCTLRRTSGRGRDSV